MNATPESSPRLVPVIDHGRCEAKRDCIRVCPTDVFDVRRIDAADFAALGLVSKLRVTAHRRATAYAKRIEECESCGLCVAACPEAAITLTPHRPKSRLPSTFDPSRLTDSNPHGIGRP